MKLKSTFAAIALLAVSAIANAKEVLPFVENDYAKAVARASSKNLPLFVDAWAPW